MLTLELAVASCEITEDSFFHARYPFSDVY
jgi:hypothetical protein